MILKTNCSGYLFQFDRYIPGAGRQRANKVLPKGWSKNQALEYDRVESARLYALATGVSKTTPLIEEAVLLYLQEHAPTLKNFKDLQGALALCHAWYAGKPLTALPDVVRQYVTDNPKLAPSTARNRMAYLRAACRWAWKTHNLGTHDPAERVVMPKGGKPRLVFFDRAAMLKIARSIKNKASRQVFRVAFYTGQRLSEVLRAEPIQAGGELALMLRDTKNGTPHIVPVHPRIAHLVRSNDWPPTVHKSTVSHHTKLAMIAVGMPHARFHDARHSAASEMINAGVDLNTVGEVLNHKTTTSTKVYAHLVTAKLGEAIRKIGGKSQPTTLQKAA